MTLVTVQPPVQKLRRERRPNEWIDGVNQFEIDAQRSHEIIGPGPAWLPHEADTVRPIDARENSRIARRYVRLVPRCVITCHAFIVNSNSGGASARQRWSVASGGGS